MDLTLTISAGVILGCFLGLSWFAGSDAPFVPTKNKKLSEVLNFAGVKKGINFYELGSGDGRVVLQAAKLGANAFGIEQSWLRVWYSRYKAPKLGSQTTSGNTGSAKFYHGNIFNRSYGDANVVYIYLLKSAVARLEEKLQRELPKGARIITQDYHFPNLKPIKKIDNFWIYRV